MAHRRPIEYGGMGQSGYAAGRHQDDHALERELETRNITYRRGDDEQELQHELGTDDRFTGRGGVVPRSQSDDTASSPASSSDRSSKWK